ncbi:MAG: glycosyltransferase, partial [Thermodesulfobacteriota bacterium]
GIIAVSGGNKKYLIEHKKINKNKIEIIWNGRDLKRFSVEKYNKNAVRKKLGIKEGIIIGNIGRLEDQKDHQTLIKAIAILKENNDINFHLIIVGEGRLRVKLEESIKYYNLSEFISLVGYQSNPEDWLAAFDCFVLSSRYEGFPLVLIEAGSMGLPIIATDVPGSEDIVLDKDRGRLVPVGDSMKMAEV